MNALAQSQLHYSHLEGDIQSRHDALSDYSAKDKPWDEHKSANATVGGIYAQSDFGEFDKYASRMSSCSRHLHFSRVTDTSTGEISLKLRESRFCRVRTCPVCQWRRSLMWKARFIQALPQLASEYPKARFLLLTLTVKNCLISDLGQELSDMNKAWQRLIKRPEFKSVQGWLRATEVTKGEGRGAHPHFHILLMVPPSYFKGGNYVKQSAWVELWRDCMRLDYEPVVDIRVVKRNSKKDESIHDDHESKSLASELSSAAAEVLKYATKPADLTEDPSWLYELTRQTFRKRFIASGGALKNILKAEEDETDADLALTNTEAETDKPDDDTTIAFGWRSADKKYRRTPEWDNKLSRK